MPQRASSGGPGILFVCPCKVSAPDGEHEGPGDKRASLPACYDIIVTGRRKLFTGQKTDMYGFMTLNGFCLRGILDMEISRRSETKKTERDGRDKKRKEESYGTA
jgi:hypothetical protein